MNKEQTEKYITRLMAYSGVVDLNKALPLQLDYLFQKLEPMKVLKLQHSLILR